MRKSIKALLAIGMILLPLTACKTTMEAEEEASYPVTYALEKNHEYTLTGYDFLSISTDTYQNNNGKIYKFSMRKAYSANGYKCSEGSVEYFYVVENIGKKDHGEYYIWYYSPCTPWSIGSYYNTK